MDNEEITIHNVYNYVSFEYNEKKQMLCIIWDSNNKIVNKIMNNESLTRDEGNLCNHYWVNEIKKVSGWVIGNRLYLRVYYFYTGMFCVKFKYTTNGVYAYEEIDEDGFLLLRKYDDTNSYHGDLERIDCLYNRDVIELNKELIEGK